ncbi:MAG: tetratricopeptide repeat protein [Proteobacteria bacterium]|nr:tetratricopeptide repeat protein [Pseudomonadota bacterium]
MTSLDSNCKSIASLICNCIYVFICNGCQTMEVKVISYPEGATVQLFDYDAQSYAEIGKTPLSLSQDQIDKFGPNISLRVQKDGYQPEQVSYARGSYTNVTSTIRLEKSITQNIQVSGNLGSSGQSGKIIDSEIHQFGVELQQINKLVQNGDYKGAGEILDRYLARFPNAAILWDMRGSIYLKLKQTPLAIKAYERSLQLFPDNGETKSKLTSLNSSQP